MSKHPLINSIKSLMDTFQLQDIWRIRNPSLRSYTWSKQSKNQFSRIDYFLTSSSLQDKLGEVDIVSSIKSDHDAITLALNAEETEKRGPGLWIFNSSLLEDETYTSEVKSLIKEIENNPGNFWEWIKYKIRKHAINYSKKGLRKGKNNTGA